MKLHSLVTKLFPRISGRASGVAQLWEVEGVMIRVTRKKIRSLRLAVTEKGVRVSAPWTLRDSLVRQFIERRLDWIRQHQHRFAQRAPAVPIEFQDGDPVWILGTRMTVLVRATNGTTDVSLRPDCHQLILSVPPSASREDRVRILESWLREEMRRMVPPMFAHWQNVLQVRMTSWSIKRMKTRWGSCNSVRGSISLNIELMRRPVECLEYVVVHELAHLLEANHGPRFYAVLDRHLPTWRKFRERLNETASPHETAGP